MPFVNPFLDISWLIVIATTFACIHAVSLTELYRLLEP